MILVSKEPKSVSVVAVCASTARREASSEFDILENRSVRLQGLGLNGKGEKDERKAVDEKQGRHQEGEG